MAEQNDTAIAATKQQEEEHITAAMEQELTDEQLVQLAEGASSWGANCNSNC
jgi:acyl CoA:acetate/3-ketoacid CoA transferase beta subunit